jgi:drug/metabolite transporter (DMT)-like permease
MSFAALLFVAASLVQGPPALAAAARGWPSLLGLVLFGTVPIPLLLVGVARIGATRAAIISTVEPVAGAACGALVLGETLSGLQLLGGALVVGAVLVTARRPAK